MEGRIVDKDHDIENHPGGIKSRAGRSRRELTPVKRRLSDQSRKMGTPPSKQRTADDIARHTSPRSSSAGQFGNCVKISYSIVALDFVTIKVFSLLLCIY